MAVWAALALAPAAHAQRAILTENFENRGGPNPIRVNAYTSPQGVTYTANDPPWLRSCNGWVLNWNDSATFAPGTADCGGQESWNSLQLLPQGLGLLNGQSAAAARNNTALSAYTSGSVHNAGNNLQLQSSQVALTGVPPGGSGRFVTFSIDAAAASCGAPGTLPPLMRFFLVENNGNETAVGATDVNPCPPENGGTGRPFSVEDRTGGGPRTIWAGRLIAPGSLLHLGDTLRVRMRNNSFTAAGNDGAVDNLRILDVSPALSKSAAALTYVGQPKALTFTITNTPEDNGAKIGWGFVDALPNGVVVAATPAATTTCGAGTAIAANAGANTITVSGGNLPGGTPGGTASSCTVTVNVVSDVAGVYANGAANIRTSTALNLPATPLAMEWVRNTLTVTKISDRETGAFGFTNGNDAAPGSLPYTIATTAAGAPGTAGPMRVLTAASLAADTTITETPPAGWTLVAATCTGLADGQAATRAGNAVTLPAAGLAPTPGGRNIACTLTNRRQSTLRLAKAWAANARAGDTVTIAASRGGANDTAAFNATAPTAADSGAPVVVDVGDAIALPAETGTNAANYTTALACTGGHTLSGTDGQQANTLTITGNDPAVCTYTNTLRTTDLTIAKTNTPAAGPRDQAGDTVVRATTTTYTLVVTNRGQTAVTGAVVRDTPQTGLDCPAANAVTCTGAACPPGAIGLGALTGAGVTLGELAAGASATLSFDCRVL